MIPKTPTNVLYIALSLMQKIEHEA
jgi:hypothetical protein